MVECLYYPTRDCSVMPMWVKSKLLLKLPTRQHSHRGAIRHACMVEDPAESQPSLSFLSSLATNTHTLKHKTPIQSHISPLYVCGTQHHSVPRYLPEDTGFNSEFGEYTDAKYRLVPSDYCLMETLWLHPPLGYLMKWLLSGVTSAILRSHDHLVKSCMPSLRSQDIIIWVHVQNVHQNEI